MSESFRVKPSTAFIIPITCLKLLGIWHYNGPFRVPYFIYGQIIYLSISVFYFVSMIMNIVQVWGDIAEMTDGLYILVTITCIIFKVGFLDKNKMKNIIEMIDSEDLNNQTRDQDCFILNSMHIIHRNALAFLLICSFVCWSWNLVPFINGLFSMRILPIKAWFPYPYNETPYYQLTYLYQFLGVWLGAVVNCSIDAMINGLIGLACGQLEVLKHSLRTLRSRALVQLDRREDENQVCDQCHNGPQQWKCDNILHLVHAGDSLEMETYQAMVKCIKYHQAIIKYVKTVQDTYTKSMFAQLSGSMLVICITAFELSVIKPFTMLYFTIVTYMVNMIIQLFFYCWYGNELYLMSMTINEDVYNSDWNRFGPRVRKLLLIMMENSKRPMSITAGKMFHLSLATFTSIMKSAYSFYAVLNQMEVDIDLENTAN